MKPGFRACIPLSSATETATHSDNLDNASQPALTDGLDDLEALATKLEDAAGSANGNNESNAGSGADVPQEHSEMIEIDNLPIRMHGGWNPINASWQRTDPVTTQKTSPTSHSTKVRKQPTSPSKKGNWMGPLDTFLKDTSAPATETKALAPQPVSNSTSVMDVNNSGTPDQDQPTERKTQGYHFWDDEETAALLNHAAQPGWGIASRADRTAQHNQWLQDKGRSYTRSCEAIIQKLAKRESNTPSSDWSRR